MILVEDQEGECKDVTFPRLGKPRQSVPMYGPFLILSLTRTFSILILSTSYINIRYLMY